MGKSRWLVAVGLAALPWVVLCLFINSRPPGWVMPAVLYYPPVAHCLYGLIGWWNWKCAGAYAGVTIAPFVYWGCRQGSCVEYQVYGLTLVVATIIAWCAARGLRLLHQCGYI